MFEQIHELVDVASKVDDMLECDDNGKFHVIDEQSNYPDNIQDFLMGVKTIVNIIQGL